MAGSPCLKVYSATGEYIAGCWYAADALAIASVRGEGATIRNGHSSGKVVWREGSETQAAVESCDVAVELIHQRIKTREYCSPAKRK